VSTGNDVYWQNEQQEPFGGLDGRTAVDVVIVGAGVGGLATAWHLAERGITSTIIEARAVASGASGRSGGFFIAGPAPMYNDARELFGAHLARRIQAATLAAQQQVYAVAEAIGAADCFRHVGMLRLAIDADEAEHVRAHARALAEDGFPGRLVDEGDLPPPLRRSGRVGLVTDHDASVHPVRLLTALAGALVRRGVTIAERVWVKWPIGTRTDGQMAILETTHGPVQAAAVVVAADGGVGALVPQLAGRVRARRLHMLATAPLRTAHVAHPVYARYGYEYFQQLTDRRILLGGFSDLDGAASYTDREVANPLVHARLARYLVEELGVEAPITHRWVGIVGYTDDERPYVGAVPGAEGVYALGGYCGSGNITAWVGGRIVADLIATGSSVDADLFDLSRNGQPAGPADADDDH
jgi:glycine/D-amino acid oxidase-like deaminating enzyme